MSVTLWSTWGPHWTLGNKVEFDGLNKLIIVHPEVTTLDIRADVYSGWVKWLNLSIDNRKWLQAMEYSGMDSIPGGETGGTFFLLNGWKLIIDFNRVAVSGVLFSRNYATAYWGSNGAALYPATVAALVNNAVTYQNVVTGTALTAEQTGAAVWGANISAHSSSGTFGEFISKKLLTVAKFLGLK